MAARTRRWQIAAVSLCALTNGLLIILVRSLQPERILDLPPWSILGVSMWQVLLVAAADMLIWAALWLMFERSAAEDDSA